MKTKRCPDCDSDGDVPTDKGEWMTCPRCDGTRKIESEPMTEEKLFQWLMISCVCLAGLSGLAAVGLVLYAATSFSMGKLICAILLAVAAVVSSYYAVLFSSRAQTPRVFANQDEKEVLNSRQRKILKVARGEVVMEKALIEVQHERENIVHKQIEAAEDPERPPHQTRWTPIGRNALERRAARTERIESPLVVDDLDRDL